MGKTENAARQREREREEREREKTKRERMTKENGTATMNGNGHAEPTKTSPTGIKMSKEVEDLLLWADPVKSGGILGGATVAYLLFHCSGYSAMYIICNLLLVGVVGTFVWSIIAQLLGKPEFPLRQRQDLHQQGYWGLLQDRQGPRASFVPQGRRRPLRHGEGQLHVHPPHSCLHRHCWCFCRPKNLHPLQGGY